MANLTGGTNGTTTLTAQQFQRGTTPSDADIASLQQAILRDGGAYPWPTDPGAWARTGLLFIPNRGILKLQPGDWVMVDPAGWPICVSGNVLPATLTRTGALTSGDATLTVTASAITAGWKPGMIIAGTDITTGTKINTISTDGLTIEMSAVAEGTQASITVTASSWTHS